jgi:type IV pilus assembly protein PilA
MPSHPEPPIIHVTTARIRTPWRRSAGFTLIEIMIVVAILGVLAALAIPAVSGYVRRTKTAEARLQLAKMFDSTAAYFVAEHVDRGDVETIGAGGLLASGASHRCPTPAPGGGSAGFTPSIDCNDGPGGRCVPSGAPSGAGYYDIDVWSGNPVWSGLDFGLEQSHYFHYDFSATNNLVGYGSCNFTAHAFGDLDGDATYSTFERTGAADQQGVNGAAGLYIDRVIE